MAAKVIECGALQRQRDRFSLEVCTAVVPLLGALLASHEPLHAGAALQLLDAILERWGPYVADVLRWGGAVPSRLMPPLGCLLALPMRWCCHSPLRLPPHVPSSSAPSHGKVDLELERRQLKGRQLRDGLRQLAPPLERLGSSLGGGRAHQMLARVRAL